MSLKLDDDDEIQAEINVTPLIDIMLVLLIVFMVTSSVNLGSGVDIELPKANQVESKNESEEKPVIVSLNKNGEVFISGKKVPEDSFVRTLKSIMNLKKSKFVILEGDELSNLGNAVKLIDLAKEAGATNFAIAAEKSN